MMNRFLLKKILVVSVVVVGFIIFVPTISSAIEDTGTNRMTNVQKRIEEIKTKREATQTKLTEKKLLSCQKREKAINNIMTRMGDRALKQSNVFTKIYERVKTFYADKGRILSNYDTLIANVDAAKFETESAIIKVQEMKDSFKCDSNDPKGDSMIFKEYKNAQNDALKAYKTSVNDLIVGIKSVQSETGDQ